ncbi:cardiolipin synthase [Pontimicrobium aquaticum]|uniref:Cardiolipin synthase n=1 Tax=Pontimicrobium aquaticum TaxID=2565367 RepID=A0A4U0ER47_9FLAO|nr:cardiolipin synthase [Pontimicrobium aquaticum]
MVTFIKDNFWSILIFLNYAIAISAALVIIQKNRNPNKTYSYILMLAIFPFLGLLVYYFFGQEYRKTKIFNRKNIRNRTVIKEVEQELELQPNVLQKIDELLDEKNKLIKLLHNNEKTKLTIHNQVNILFNGEEKFKYLIEDIQQATHHIHLEYYILKDDTIGGKVISALCKKAKEGIKVRVSFDDVGSKISKKARQQMSESGVEFYPFMPVLFNQFTGKMNYRNHRKIVVIDGEIGYVGGMNISDNYMNYETDKIFWRDTHLRIKGEAVKSLQILFLTTWQFVSNNNLKITNSLFSSTKLNNKLGIQIASSGPDSDWANIMEAIFTAITNAEDYVYITTPYFIPNDEIITAIQVAARCDIDVRIIIPKSSDSWTAQYATNSYIEKLLEANVKVYRYSKGFVHAKTMVIDDVFSSVGTANMDYRSFNINFEVNALVYDEGVSNKLKKQFMLDIEDCEEVDYNSWKKRPRLNKIKESFCRLWAPLL